MKAYDFNAVVFDGSVFCNECLPPGVNIDDAEVQPIFADEEWDAPAVCDWCDAQHDYMQLRGD